MTTSELTDSERKRVQKYLLLDVSQLYSLIPPYLDAYKHTAFNPDGQKEVGKECFEGMRGKLEQRLCVEWSMCEVIKDPSLEDSLKLVAALGDAIATIKLGVPPLLISVIIVRIGVRKFCRCP